MAKLHTTKTPITGADLLNDRVLPFFAEQGMGVIRMQTDRGTEYCGKPETHDYQLYLALNDIEHTKAKARHPQTNGICERFHKTILQEFYQGPSVGSSIYHWRSYRPTSMPGWTTTTTSEPITVRCAADARLCKP